MVGATTNTYAWDRLGAAGLGTVVGDGQAEYAFGPAGLQQRTVGAASRYAQGDGLGSVRLITDGAGNATGSATFEPWGAPRSGSATLGGFGFTGEQTDAETGFVYLRARHYDPASGRFMQQDTWPGARRDPQSLNRFAYVTNNPGNAIDPSGHCGVATLGGRQALFNPGCAGGGGGGGDIVITIAIVTAAAGVFTMAGVTISNWWQQLCSTGSDRSKPSDPERRQHIQDEHTFGGADSEGNSKFYDWEEDSLDEFAEKAGLDNRKEQQHGTYTKTYETGREIGVDRQGKETTVVTVVTDAEGNVITIHPGYPSK